MWSTMASFHRVSQRVRSVSEHAQQQSSGTSSPKFKQPPLMSWISPVLFLLWQLKTSIVKPTRLLAELVPELWYCACSLPDLLAVTLTGRKTFVGYTCVGPQNVCYETHGYLRAILRFLKLWLRKLRWVVYLSEGQWFDPWLLQSACQRVLVQNTEHRIIPDGVSISVCVRVCVCVSVCLSVFDEQIGWILVPLVYECVWTCKC